MLGISEPGRDISPSLPGITTTSALCSLNNATISIAKKFPLQPSKNSANLFLPEDSSVAIIAYESDYEKANFVKYINYAARVIRRCALLPPRKKSSQAGSDAAWLLFLSHLISPVKAP